MDESHKETTAERQLRGLERLRSAGMVTEDEYQRKRSELLDRALTEMAEPSAPVVAVAAAPAAHLPVHDPIAADSPYPFPWRWAAVAAASLGTLLVMIALLLPRVTVSADNFAATTVGWSEWMTLAIWSTILGGSIVFTALFALRGARQLSFGYICWWMIQASYLGYDSYIDNQPSNWHAGDTGLQANAVMLQWENGFYLLCAGLVLILVGAILLCRWQWLARSRTTATAVVQAAQAAPATAAPWSQDLAPVSPALVSTIESANQHSQ